MWSFANYRFRIIKQASFYFIIQNDFSIFPVKYIGYDEYAKKITFLEEKDCNMFIKDGSKKPLFYKSMINSL